MRTSRPRWTLLLAAVLLFAFALSSAATAEAKPIKRCNGQRVLCDQPFNEIVLAGAHNAMSSQSLDWVLPNQSVAIPEQLTSGIRGYLIDTHYGRMRDDGSVVTDDDGTVSPSVGPRGTYLCHVYCELGATPLVEGLRAYSDFLERHPNNVLLIENEDYIEPADFAKAVEKSGLRDHVYEGPTDTWPSAREMIAGSEQVVFLADNHGGDIPWYHETYAGIVQETPYNFEKFSEITRASNWAKSCGPNRGDVTGSMFLMNHWSPSTRAARARHRGVRARQRPRGDLQPRPQVRPDPRPAALDHRRRPDTIGGLVHAVRDLNGLAVVDPRPRPTDPADGGVSRSTPWVGGRGPAPAADAVAMNSTPHTSTRPRKLRLRALAAALRRPRARRIRRLAGDRCAQGRRQVRRLRRRHQQRADQGPRRQHLGDARPDQRHRPDHAERHASPSSTRPTSTTRPGSRPAPTATSG